MKKQVLIGLLGVLSTVVSCSTDVESISDHVQAEEVAEGTEVELEGSIKDSNPFDLSVALIAQRDALLVMADNTNNVNWSTDVDMSNWDTIAVDSNGNVVSLTIDASFVNVGDTLEVLTYLNSLNINGDATVVEGNLDLPSLQNLTITSGTLTYIPNWILETESLTSIYYSDSKLESIPNKIGQLINLEYLTVDDGTPLENVSANLAGISNLISIDFSSISIDTLNTVPAEICNLASSGVEVLLPAAIDCN